jgi:hypothetical protein
MFAVSWPSIKWGSIDWGTAPSWVAAGATFFATGVALWLASAERRHRELTEARTAARGLTVEPDVEKGTDEAGRPLRIYKVAIHNTSDQTFRDIRVEYSDPRLVTASVDRLPPGAISSDEVGRTLDTDEERAPEWTSFTTSFHDERGHRWVRDREDVLRRELPRRPWRWRARLE